MPINLDANEHVRLTKLAALSHGRTAQGGKLFVTDKRIVFRPGVRARMFGAAEIAFARSAVADIQVEPTRSGLFSGGFRHRILVRLKDGSEHHFAVNRPQTFASAVRAELSIHTGVS